MVISAALPPLRGVMFEGLKGLYGMGVDANAYIDRHIADLRKSEVPSTARTGNVLEAAKLGFGLGYASSAVVMVAGQLLLGNPLVAAKVVITTATLTNPIAMTCAAVGAIYYGWNALSVEDREDILARLSESFEWGLELIRSIINFDINGLSDLSAKIDWEAIASSIREGRDSVKVALKNGGDVLVDISGQSGDFLAAKSNEYWLKVKGAIPAGRRNAPADSSDPSPSPDK